MTYLTIAYVLLALFTLAFYVAARVRVEDIAEDIDAISGSVLSMMQDDAEMYSLLEVANRNIDALSTDLEKLEDLVHTRPQIVMSQASISPALAAQMYDAIADLRRKIGSAEHFLHNGGPMSECPACQLVWKLTDVMKAYEAELSPATPVNETVVVVEEK